MSQIAEYTLGKLIDETRGSFVYRASRGDSGGDLGKTVVIKIPKTKNPTPAELARFLQEYELIKKIQIDGVLKVLEIVPHENGYALILEDFAGTSLKRIADSRTISLNVFLQIALKISSALGSLHQEKIVHLDIKPHNILMNWETGVVKITDFGIAAVLTHANEEIYNHEVMEGTLPYISPEQTGRMNRSVDYRTDLYSLGVTFYELLTGKLPFISNDPMEIIHGHIAKVPAFPISLNASIPQVLSDIVMKLMSKNAEDRYQSAFGLMADLQACLNLLKPNGEITPFSLAQNDHSSRFNIPQKLYGRDDEVNTLMAAFGRAATGRSGLMLVAGDPGIGKSALINEVHKPILERRGYFIAGKYEQFRSDVPYSSVMQAFQRLIRQLLSESEERISFWANQIQKAVGVNGKLITDLIPSMELIIGKQAEVEVLGAEESRNRFEHVFRNFIRVFATAEHPLVFFLDDLQWADNASLLLVKNILTDHNSKHLLMIGAFRDGDVNFTHPLHVVLGDLSKAGVPIDRVSLPVLKIDRISELISDVLMVDRSTAHPLAEVVKEKTNGNPFFINQFLQVLHDENMLEFDSTSGWHWDMARINSMQVTDNVVYLMASKIDLLPPGTKELLQIGACFGNRFELEPLSYVAGTSLKETLDNLLYALNDGLVGLNQEFYEFRHDRIQEAAYSMMTPEKRMSTHQRIGRLALQNTPLEQRNERIFYIVNQLNQGVSLVNDQAEMAQLVALNIAAGRMARSTAAFVQAFHYYEFAMRMLTPDSWSQSYETTLALFNEGAETAYLSGKFAEMEQMSAQVMLKANNILDKVPIYQVRMSTYMAMGDPRSAVNIALEILRFLKIRFPKKPSMFDFVTSVVKSKIFLWGNRKKNLADLPDVTDPYALATLKILAQACSAAYFSMPVLCFLMTIKAFRLSVTYGSTTHTPYIFAQYGGILCAFTDFGTGYKFGKLALGLLPKLRFGEQYAKVKIFVNTYVMHWKEHVRDALPVFKDAHPISLESGDLEFAAFSALMYCYHSFYSGVHLEALERELARYISIVADTKQDPTLNLLKVHHQLILNLLGKAESDYQLIGPSYNENEAKPTSGSELYKLQLRYLLGHFEEALECGNWVGRRKTGIAATFHLPEFRFYDALMRLALCRKVERQRQKNRTYAKTVEL